MYGPRLPWPADWSQIFGRPAPLLLEIGFGGGQFLLDLAQRHPGANVLGVEIAAPSLRKAGRRIGRAAVANVRLLHADAQLALWGLCAPGTISGLYVNFPDPWPKSGHHQRRLINLRFLDLVATRLRPNSPLAIATDDADYAQIIADCLGQSPYFASQVAAVYLTEDTDRLRTKYEQLALAAGRTCYYFKWRRNDFPPPNDFPVPQELPMPYVLLETPLTLAEIIERFRPQQFTLGEIHVKFLNVYQSQHQTELLIETYVTGEAMNQRLGFSIRRRVGGQMALQLHEIGFPRPTAGVHRAADHLAEWLLTLSNEQ
ncbi:MAG: tRNA (guanosine(46)-N7)-methyltransferase TrmB [Chloroflexota bacterium]